MNRQNISLIGIVLLVLSACCPTDHTHTIKKIMRPMSENLYLFFKNEGVYPNENQRDSLIEQSGCKITDTKQKLCKYNGKVFTYESNIELSHNDYFFSIAKKNSHCHINMSPSGIVEPIECVKDSCINIDP